jgi:hypothetical protein
MKTNMIGALALFALASITRAINPPPDGGYPGANTAEGNNALFSLTTGQNNTAVGDAALKNNTAGSLNTAIGANALGKNKTGRFGTASLNTAIGASALFNNSGGDVNTAIGVEALFSNTRGAGNTSTGREALFSNTTGSDNIASGVVALFLNTTGSGNAATGGAALYHNSTGEDNTAAGNFALYRNSTGSDNIGLGANAGVNLSSGDHNIDIGNRGFKDEANTIRIGSPRIHNRTFIAGIRGVTTTKMDAVPVVIDSDGQLGTVSSSARFKDEIKPMDKASEAILALKPVTFHYKSDNTGTPQFGLITEEVAKMNSDLVVRDEKGEIYTVRYDAVNAMLLNEFLKEHRIVEEQQRRAVEQEARLTRQESIIAQQQKEIAALKQGLRRVSEQLNESGRGTIVSND